MIEALDVVVRLSNVSMMRLRLGFLFVLHALYDTFLLGL
jgi:hypothetical protein